MENWGGGVNTQVRQHERKLPRSIGCGEDLGWRQGRREDKRPEHVEGVSRYTRFAPPCEGTGRDMDFWKGGGRRGEGVGGVLERHSLPQGKSTEEVCLLRGANTSGPHKKAKVPSHAHRSRVGREQLLERGRSAHPLGRKNPYPCRGNKQSRSLRREDLRRARRVGEDRLGGVKQKRNLASAAVK